MCVRWCTVATTKGWLHCTLGAFLRMHCLFECSWYVFVWYFVLQAKSEARNIIYANDVKKLFPNIESILKLHEENLKNLELRVKNW